MKYYFVSYAYRYKDGGNWNYSNVILRDVHPVKWFCNPAPVFQKHYASSLLWWTEIDEETSSMAKGVIGTEDGIPPEDTGNILVSYGEPKQ